MGVSYANCKNIQQETKYYDFRVKTWSTDIVHLRMLHVDTRSETYNQKRAFFFGKKWKVLLLSSSEFVESKSAVLPYEGGLSGSICC